MTDAPPPPSIDRTEKSGNPWLVVFLSLLFVGAAALPSFLPPELDGRVTIGLLALLAIIGVVCLFAFAIGFIHWGTQSARNDVIKLMNDTSSDGLLLTTADQRILYANAAYMNLSATHELSQIRSIDRLFAGTADVSEAIYRLSLAAREGKHATEEIRLSPALSGETVGWYRIRVRPLEHATIGSASLWTVSDITRERERHENVFQELQHAIDFLDHAPSGFFSAEPDGSISYMNATLATWLDYDLAQVGSGGLRTYDILAGDGAALLSAISGSAGEVKTEQIDVDLKRRNGQSLPVRLIHRIAFGQDGLAGASRTLILNRAAGEEPSENLRAAEVRFARFFNQTPVAIAAVDSSGYIVRANAAFARLCPQALKGEGGRMISAVIGERERPLLQSAINAAANGKSDVDPIDVELIGEPKHAARLYVSPSEESEEGTSAIIFALDMTEQRTLQESFAQSQKMQAIGQLAGGVAHDFNNVLTAIIGYSDLLLANHRPTDPAFQDIMQIKQNANRAAGLVRQLLAFSRRQTLRPQVLQLSDVLSELQMLLRRLVGEKISIDFRHGRDLWLIKADINQLEQVIINLVVNARDAMTEGGRVSLTTRNISAQECAGFHENLLIPADYVLIEVEDTGHGIPADIKSKIFEPFFTTKEVGKGTGLGLSMVYGIVKQTGGWIFCDSIVGKGTIFRIFLPRHIADEKDIEAQKEVTKAPTADLTGQGTILLVEDEEAVRAFGARALISRGYTVLEANSGTEALDVVDHAQGKIDLIISDVVMPEMDGPSMLGELRKRNIKAKIIFVSGYAEDAFARNLPAGEDFGFLPKPFTLKQLIETVKNNIGTQN
jgi:two-component system, cell cycle sensor histidine kinase and response regulator CckA